MIRVLAAAGAAALALPAAASGAVPLDVTGDGRQDIVLGLPGWSEGGAPNAGAALVLRGGGAARSLLLMEGAHGLPGVPEGDDALGTAVASGDFDGDGFEDLALAAPGDGVTLVVPGGRGGLRTGAARELRVAGPLVAGDLDGDGDAELVVGVLDANEILVFSGHPAGLSETRRRTLHRPSPGFRRFGETLAVGDVDGDGHRDLVEGAQGVVEALDEGGRRGHLAYCPGTRNGASGCRRLGRPIAGGPGVLAVADVDGDGRDDVAAGRPVDGFVLDSTVMPPGEVRLWRGSPRGPRAGPRSIAQGERGVPGSGERGDAFGAALAAADVDGDGRADLIVGAPGEDHGRGRVTLLRGGPDGVAAAGHRTFELRTRRRGDGFGAAVGTLAVRKGRIDVVAGAPGDRSLTFLRRGARRFSFVRLSPTALGIAVPPEPPDALGGFGSHLARLGGS